MFFDELVNNIESKSMKSSVNNQKRGWVRNGECDYYSIYEATTSTTSNYDSDEEKKKSFRMMNESKNIYNKIKETKKVNKKTVCFFFFHL
jgi:hypothetical protein